MKNLKQTTIENLVNIGGVNTVNILADYPKGKFRFVTKCRAGFMTISDAREYDNDHFIAHPESIIANFTKGSLQTAEFCPDGGDYYLTIFARKGNKIVIIDKTILGHLTVGTINQLFPNTNLYNQEQYNAVGARTWADRAYVPYQVPMEA
jgi:hypothetical protein